MKAKQIIVIRKDLKMRRGKEIAQGAHASMAWLTERLREAIEHSEKTYLTSAESDWVHGRFIKIVVKVNSEEELDKIAALCEQHGLTSHLIVDAGFTEFNHVLTKTALGIGPYYEDEIDPITKDLILY